MPFRLSTAAASLEVTKIEDEYDEELRGELEIEIERDSFIELPWQQCRAFRQRRASPGIS